MEGKTLSPFDLARNINEKTGRLNAEEVGFNPYMMNRIFSNTKDTILFANEMNALWRNVTPEMHYDFFYHGISKKRRYGKWHKSPADDEETLQVIQDAQGMSRQKARDVVDILQPVLEELKSELRKGGRNGK